MKIDMLMWKEVEETQGPVPVTFSVKSPLQGEGGSCPRRPRRFGTTAGGINSESTKHE